MTTLLIATRNAHKVEEIRAILGAQFQYLTLRDFPAAPPVIEDAPTFAGNATKKAMELAQWVAAQPAVSAERGGDIFVLADDSGLEVDALQGAPGVHSARFAAVDATRSGYCSDAQNNLKLLGLMRDVPAAQRTARFRCVIALTPVMKPSDENASPVCAANKFEFRTELFEGACEGQIAFGPAGTGGFGYDPLFVPKGHKLSFAELSETVKNTLSHRAKALAKLREKFDSPAR